MNVQTEKTKEDIEKELEDEFHKTIASFKIRWLNKNVEISSSGLYNYAFSLMKIEFRKKFDKDKEEKILNIYKPK